MTALTPRELVLIPPEELIRQINPLLQGWVGYFHYRNCSKAMNEVKTHAEQRLRIWLRNRHKVRSWKAGYMHFPSASRVRENRTHGLMRGGRFKPSRLLYL